MRRRTPVLVTWALVAAGALALPAASGAADAVYGGHLGASDDPIVVTANAGTERLKSTVVAFTTTCTGGDASRRVFHDAVGVVTARKGVSRPGVWEMSRNAGGRFTGTYTRPIEMGADRMVLTMTISGRLTRDAASGTLSAESVLASSAPVASPAPAGVQVLERCRTGTLRWATVHRPGVVFGGRTAQGEPFVAQVSTSRRRVDELHIGWHAECLPGGGVDFPETFERFTLTSTGRFSDTFTQRYENSSGSGDNVYDYAISGRMGRRAASGTFSAKVTYPDGTVCGTASQRWSAAST